MTHQMLNDFFLGHTAAIIGVENVHAFIDDILHYASMSMFGGF